MIRRTHALAAIISGARSILAAGVSLMLLLPSVALANERYFMLPSEVSDVMYLNATKINLLGILSPRSVEGSLDYGPFTVVVTDKLNSVKVHYDGGAPDLLEEGSVLIARGSFHGKDFYAHSILLPINPDYFPPEAWAQLRLLGVVK